MTIARTIAVWLDNDLETAFALLEGIQDYARRHMRWRVLPLQYTQEDLLLRLLREKRIDGVIGAFISDRWLEGLPGGVPMVNTGTLSAVERIPSVVADDAAVGRLACAHLLEGKPTALACLHEPASHAARLRRAGFLEAAGATGLVAHEPPRHEGFAPGANWRGWLAELPAGTGIFCTGDPLARQVAAHAQALGRAIPESLTVLGVGDQPMSSMLTAVPLSSIPLPSRRIGWHAAETLRLCLSNRKPPRVRRIPPETVHVRESTARPHLDDPFLAAAMAHMRRNLNQPPDIPALLATLRISRRALELRFRRTGLTPAAAWRGLQLNEAKRLLTQTKLSLTAIAEETGWSSPHHFSTAFRKATGRTPGAFRQKP